MCHSEKLIMQMADRMAEDGYRDVGYEYVCIDDCWLATSRDASNNLQPDPARFPSGMKALADYVGSFLLYLCRAPDKKRIFSSPDKVQKS